MSAKKIFKIAWISAAILLGIVLVLAVVVWLTVDTDMIESAMEKQLSRKVEIGRIKAGLFSSVSGFDIEEVAISDLRTRGKIDSEDKIDDDEIFMSLESLKLNFEFWPLLRRQLRIRSLLITQPEIHLVRYPDGTLNVSDLMTAGSSEKEMGAEDLPLALDIERIRVSDGVLLFEDQTNGSRYRIHSFNLEIFDIRIDPRNLEQHNSFQIQADALLESVLIPSGGFAQEVTSEFRMQGQIQPFDPKTGKSAPQVNLKIETPSGLIKGSALFARLRSSPLLNRFGVAPEFLPDDLDWKNGSILLSMAGDVIQLEEGAFRLEGYGMNYSGAFDLKSEAVAAELELLLDRDLNAPVRQMLGIQADAALRSDMKKYVSGDDIAQTLLSVMQNEDQQIQLSFRISGTLQDPKTELQGPASTAMSAAVQNLVAERARAAGEHAVKEKLTDKLKGLIKKK